jgi:tetratricopeptide (TPR) repeat protein
MLNKPAPKQDFEALTVILSVAAVVAMAALVATLPGWQGLSATPASMTKVRGYTQGHSLPAHVQNKPIQKAPLTLEQGVRQAFRDTLQEPQTEAEMRVAERFTQAVSMLHAKRYKYAITALDAVLELAPELPEAYVNMGYAFIGLEEYGPARGAFEKAIGLKVDQVNAYYGLAIAFEGAGELEAALGSMRTYIHLSKPNDPYLTKARAALWEWEALLGRIKGVGPAPKGAESPAIKVPGWDSSH